MLLKDNELSRKEQRLLYEQTEEFRFRQEKKKKRKSLDKTRFVRRLTLLLFYSVSCIVQKKLSVNKKGQFSDLMCFYPF